MHCQGYHIYPPPPQPILNKKDSLVKSNEDIDVIDKRLSEHILRGKPPIGLVAACSKILNCLKGRVCYKEYKQECL